MKPRLFLVMLFMLLAAASVIALVVWPTGAATIVQPATTQSGPQLVLVSQVDVGGPAYAVAVQGDYAYVGAGNRLAVVDVSDPTTPQVVGQTEPFSDSVAAVSVTGTHAYLAANTAGLRVVDISDPAAPQEVGNYDTSGTALDVDVSGHYAYIADGDGGLRVVDVFTPTAPQEIGFLNTPGTLLKVQATGSYAYAINATSLLVIDTFHPARPSQVSDFVTTGANPNKDLFASGDYIYAASYAMPDPCERWGCIRFIDKIDVSDPTSLALVSSEPTGWHIHAIYGFNSYIFVTTENGVLVMIDFSQSDPEEKTFFAEESGYGWDVYAKATFVYVASDMAGLAIWWYGPECTSAARLQAAADHWKRSAGEPGYSPTDDRDQDGVISMMDIQDLARWWHPWCL